MQHRKLSLAVAGLLLAAGSFAANAAIVFTNLGNGSPPASVGGHALTPFDAAPQNAIPDGTGGITVIPGNPGSGDLSINRSAIKWTTPYTWNSDWAGGYVGAVYLIGDYGNYPNDVTLTLPPGTQAFYFYTSAPYYGTYNMSATTDNGVSSGMIPVTTGFPGSNGFAFYSTAGESISSITVTSSMGLGIGVFGISQGPATTCASEGYIGTKLLWCQNICEKGYTGATLDAWIHRWITRYRDLPYCAAEEAPAFR